MYRPDLVPSLSASFASGWLAPARDQDCCPERPDRRNDMQPEACSRTATSSQDVGVHAVPAALLPPPKLATVAEQRAPVAAVFSNGLGRATCLSHADVRVPGTLVRRCSKADSEALSTTDSNTTTDCSSGVSSSGSNCGNFSDRTSTTESATSENLGQSWHLRQELRQDLLQMPRPPADWRRTEAYGLDHVEEDEAGSAAAFAALHKRHAAEIAALPCNSDIDECCEPGKATAAATRPEVSPTRQLRRAADPRLASDVVEIQQPMAWHPCFSQHNSLGHADTEASRSSQPVPPEKDETLVFESRSSLACSDGQANRRNCSNPSKPPVATRHSTLKGSRSAREHTKDGSNAGIRNGQSCDRSCSGGPPRRVRRGRRSSTSSTGSIPETVSSMDAPTEQANKSGEQAPCDIERSLRKSEGQTPAQQDQQSCSSSLTSKSSSSSACRKQKKEGPQRTVNASMQLMCALADMESMQPAEQELAQIEDIFLAQTRTCHKSSHSATEACAVDSSPPTPEYLWFGGRDQFGEGGATSASLPCHATVEIVGSAPSVVASDAQRVPIPTGACLDVGRAVSCGSDCSPLTTGGAHDGLHFSPTSQSCLPLTLADKLRMLEKHETWQDAHLQNKPAGVPRRRRRRQSSASASSQTPVCETEQGGCMDSACTMSSTRRGTSLSNAVAATLTLDDRGTDSAELPSTIVGRGRGRRCRARKAAKSAPPQAVESLDPWQTLAEEDAQSCEAHSCVKVLRPKRIFVQQHEDAGQAWTALNLGPEGDCKAASSRAAVFPSPEGAAATGRHSSACHTENTKAEADEQASLVQTCTQVQALHAQAPSPAASSENEQDYWDAPSQWSSAGSQRHVCARGQHKTRIHSGSVVRQEAPRRRSTGREQSRSRQASKCAGKPMSDRRARDRDAFVVLGDPLGSAPSFHPSSDSLGPSEPPVGFWQTGV